MRAKGYRKYLKGWVLVVFIVPFCLPADRAEAKAASLVEKAKELQAQGKYQSAIKIYEKILKKTGVKSSPDKLEEVRKDYEAVKIKRLLSRAENIQNLNYTVAEGDTLYELAQKYGTTTDLIKRHNDLKSDLLYPEMKLKILQGVFALRVDKSDNQLALLLNGKPLKRYPVATGAENKTPVGSFKIANKVEHPTWYRTGAVVPAGSADNLLGTRWLGFDLQGYGIHGTVEPESIGKHVSLGCIRMLNEDVEELYSLLPLGTRVTITD